jgi:Ion channel
MLLEMAISGVLVVSSILIHYESLRLMSTFVPNLKVAVRVKVLIVVIGCFFAHTLEVWLYAGAFLLIFKTGLGSLKGQVDESFADFLYFSATSYSTMGIGDVYPTGALRLISGIEGINGLFLIAWSTSFTYFVMDRLWPLHPDTKDG